MNENELNSTNPPPSSEAQNIMSFLTATTTSTTPGSSTFAGKHIIRQEGFHPSSPGANTTPPPPGSSSGSTAGGYELFNSFLPDPFRKFPGQNGPADFTEELASLMQQDNRSSSSSNGSAGGGDRFSRPHNIFDISAPTANGNNSSSNNNNDYPTHFNQTLPALNSSLRYEPDPAPQQQHHQPPPPPSSFHHPFTRHTPSPTSLSSSLPHTTASRSRSRSRPPSGGDQSNNTTSGNTGSIGPARTTRSRRNNSVSGTSPPPGGRPHAIVIPRSRAATVSGGGPGVTHHNQWFLTGHSAASEYSLPTPESLASPLLSHSHSNHNHSHSVHSPATHHLSHSIAHGSPPLSHSPANHHAPNPNGQQQQQHPYSSFSLSPPPPEPSSAVHLPPVSTLSHQHNPNNFNVMGASPGSPHSLPTIHSNIHNMHGSMHHNSNMGMGASSGMMNGNSGHHHSSSIGHGHGHTSSVGSTGAFNISNMSNGLPPSQSGAAANVSLSPAEKQAAIANEKRRRRRESHNAVERRRRDNINEKISELATLIPECMLDPATTGSATSPIANINPSSPILPGQSNANANANSDDAASPGGAGSDSNNTTTGQPSGEANGVSPTGSNANASANGAAGPGGVVKANKGMILRKSVDYIRYLQQLVEAQGARNRLLEAELKSWREGEGGKVPPGAAGSLNINTNMNGQWTGYQGGWLPSMPESRENEDDDDGDDVDMDQESDDGEQPKRRGRQVNGKKGASKKRMNGTVVKEEMSHGVDGEMMVM